MLVKSLLGAAACRHYSKYGLSGSGSLFREHPILPQVRKGKRQRDAIMQNHFMSSRHVCQWSIK